MRQKILALARELFGEARFEEIQGELWLDYPRFEAKLLKRVPRMLREWENRFRRDREEGRVQSGSSRRRVLRLGELETDLDGLRVRRRF